MRRRLPADRPGVTRSFSVAGEGGRFKLYFTASTYGDGRVGEVFVKADRAGGLARGTLDAVGVLVSMLLQHGVPVAEIAAKLRHTRYEPSGFTGDAEFPSCSSPLDLLAQWLQSRALAWAVDACPDAASVASALGAPEEEVAETDGAVSWRGVVRRRRP